MVRAPGGCSKYNKRSWPGSIMCLFILLLLMVQLGTSYIVKLTPTFNSTQTRSATYGSPWPLPSSWAPDEILMTIDPEKFAFTANLKNCDVIDEAFLRYEHIIFQRGVSYKSRSHRVLESIVVHVSGDVCEQYPWKDMDEQYDLRLSLEGKAYLNTTSVWGVLRGLETFSQLIWRDDQQQFLVKKSRIKDKPRYKHRGIMIDTTSHFIPVKILKMNLDAMAYNKMNVFHWHIIGDESFPFASRTYPELYEQGAYSDRHVYSYSDIRDVIQYARLRGIRVIPEINVISHNQAIRYSHPELFLPCVDKSGAQIFSSSLYHPARYVINPTIEETYTLLSAVVTELQNLFPEPFIHLGYDTAADECWTNSAVVKEAVKKEGWKDIHTHFYEQLMATLPDTSPLLIVWHNPVLKHIKFNVDQTLVQIGQKSSKLAWLLRQINNVKVLLSWDDFAFSKDSWAELMKKNTEKISDLDDSMIYGGEALVWTEHLDGTNLLPNLWPKASVLAEILWSTNVGDQTETMFRLDEQRCRLVRRDIPAIPMFAGHCGDREYDGLVVNTGTNNRRKVSASIWYIIIVCLMDTIHNIFTGGSSQSTAAMNAETT